MSDLEIPLGKRTKKYRFFEMLPAILSYGLIILLFVLSLLSPLLAAIYVTLIIVIMFIRATIVAVDTMHGRDKLNRAMEVNWHERLLNLEKPNESLKSIINLRQSDKKQFDYSNHLLNLKTIAKSSDGRFPKPSQVYNAIIIAAYNEPIEVIEPTIKSLVNTTYDKSHLIIIFAYEQRGGDSIKETAEALQRKYSKDFFAFHIVQHPSDIPDEVVGKGGNITYAGYFLKQWLRFVKIDYSKVIVTTLDCDNRPHEKYLDYVTYEFIVHKNRKNLAYQPVSLFLNNIWDAPAPMRVIATGSSFWNIICSVRPKTLRNFASHAQPMDALVGMNFWSTRTIVEDGHQYWRSFFFFKGNYEVIPLYIPIYQDAVMSDSYVKTLKAQFIQLRRWAYGASDVPYVAVRVFSRDREAPFFTGLVKFIELIDSHVTLASMALLVAFGGWVPLLVNNHAARNDITVHNLPDTISMIQSVAMIGLIITVILAYRMLPPRPKRYKKSRSLFMIIQWILMPVTTIVYNSFSALYSQGRLLFGKYLDKFDVTEKTTVSLIDNKKEIKKQIKTNKNK
jgi:cellulose synthase/poly-beta-1,6-N-acetylglucosamine synthase-like glycosyltransferase/uncharacterized membrane protein